MHVKIVHFRRTANVFAFIGAILVALLLLLFIFSQTEWSRRLIIHELVKTVETSTNGTLTIGKLDGNLITGFVLSDVNLKLNTKTAYDTVPLLHADQALVRYSLIRYLRRNEIGVTSIVLKAPVFNILKWAGDTNWNFGLLTKPVAKNQPPPQKFNQIVDLQSLIIQNGSVRVRDYNFPNTVIEHIAGDAEVKQRQFDWADIKIQGLDFDGRMYAKGSDAVSFRANHLRFEDQSSGFFLQHAELSAYLDSLQSRLDNAHIVTGHSDIRFTVDVAPPTILHGGLFTSLQNSETQLSLYGPYISTYELKQFVPSLGFLNGTPGIDLVVRGKFGKLKVEKLNLDFKGRGTIGVNGYLYNLHDPKKLSLDVNLTANNLTNASLVAFVPGLKIPDLSAFGTINIPNIHFKGEPTDFATTLDVRTSAGGNVAGTADLDLSKSFVYNANLRTQHLNVAAILKDKKWQSDLNANIKAKGVGANWRTLNTAVTIATTSPSHVGSYAAQYVNGSFTMNHGILKTPGISFAMVGGPTADIKSAVIDFNSHQPIFQFNGKVTDFAPAKYFPSFPAKGMLIDFTADLSGRGSALEYISGKVDAKLHNLVLNGEHLKDVNASIAIGPRGSHNAVSLKSEIADLDMEGKFSMFDLIKVIPSRISAVTEAISKRYFPDLTQPSVTPQLSGVCGDSIDFGFGVNVKDLRPLAVLVPKSLLLVQGNIQGSVFGCSARDLNIVVSADTFAFLNRDRRFAEDSITAVLDSLGDTVRAAAPPGSRIQLTRSRFTLTLGNLIADPRRVLEVMNAHFEYRSDSVVRYNTALVYRPRIFLDYKNQQLSFNVGGIYNNTTGVRLKGSASFPNGDLAVTVDTLRFALNRNTNQPYAWQNDGPSHLIVAKNGLISLDTLSLMRPALGDRYNLFAQRIKVGGAIQGDTILSAWVKVPMMRISEIDSLLPPSAKSLAAKLGQFAGVVQAFDVSMSGTLAKPNVDAYLKINNLKYNGLAFDSAVADLHYRDLALKGRIGIHVDSASFDVGGVQTSIPNLSSLNALNVDIGSIPFQLAFKHGATYSADSARVKTMPVSASLKTNHFPLDIVGPFIPVFTNFRGIGDVDIKVGGTLANIDYSGSASIKDGLFLLAANNIYYTCDGVITFQNEELRFNRIQVHNISADDPNGAATLTGGLKFKGFSVVAFDLAVTSDRITVLTDNSRMVMRNFYGPLQISTSGEPLTLAGPLTDPVLSGNVTVLQAFLKLPQGSGGKQVGVENVIYRSVKQADTNEFVDTSAAGKMKRLQEATGLGNISTPQLDNSDRGLADEDIYAEEGLSAEDAHAHAVIDSMQTNRKGTSTGSFVDRLQFSDFQVNIQRDVWVTISFNGLLGLLGQQLIADLRTTEPIYIERGSDHRFHVRGKVNLSPNSSYTFLKRFSPATGTIEFSDDPTNPSLAITAEYTGQHHGPEGDDEVTVRINLTGTEKEPHLVVQVLRKDPFGNLAEIPGTDQDQLENATYFLLSGQLKSEMNDPAVAGLIAKGAGTAFTNQFANSLLERAFGTSAVGNVLRQFSFDYAGSRSRLQLTAGYRDITIRYGGYVNSLYLGDYSVEVPFSTFANFRYARNLLLEFDIHSGDQSSTDQIIQQPNFLAKGLWRFPLP